MTGAAPTHRNGLVRRSRRGPRTGHRHTRVPQELGTPYVSTSTSSGVGSQTTKPGVLEGRELTYSEAGTPQGGVISPLLANVYLHYVLDVWFEEVVKPCLKGRAFLVRYADDFVMGFACEEDRPPRAGRAAEAVRQVRSGAPSGENPAGAVSTASQPSCGVRLRVGTSSGVV